MLDGDGRVRDYAGLDRRIQLRNPQAAADFRHGRHVAVLHPVDRDVEARAALAGLVDPEPGPAEILERVALAVDARDPPAGRQRPVLAAHHAGRDKGAPVQAVDESPLRHGLTLGRAMRNFLRMPHEKTAGRSSSG